MGIVEDRIVWELHQDNHPLTTFFRNNMLIIVKFKLLIFKNMKKKSKTVRHQAPSQIIQIGIIFFMVMVIILVAYVFKFYT